MIKCVGTIYYTSNLKDTSQTSPISCATKIGNAFLNSLKEVSHAPLLSSACEEGCCVILLLQIKKHQSPPLSSSFELLTGFYEQTSKPQ